jgi:hypothetical protein
MSVSSNEDFITLRGLYAQRRRPSCEAAKNYAAFFAAELMTYRPSHRPFPFLL